MAVLLDLPQSGTSYDLTTDGVSGGLEALLLRATTSSVGTLV